LAKKYWYDVYLNQGQKKVKVVNSSVAELHHFYAAPAKNFDAAFQLFFKSKKLTLGLRLLLQRFSIIGII
jgi:hypothetical protein